MSAERSTTDSSPSPRYAKTGTVNTTFAQLFNHTGLRLRLTGTNVHTGMLDWFDADLTPDVPVALAVRASSSIPFVFEAVPVQRVKGGPTFLYVDGGALRNLPLEAFQDETLSKSWEDHAWKAVHKLMRITRKRDRSASTIALSLRGAFELSRGVSDTTIDFTLTSFAARLWNVLLWGPESSNSLLQIKDVPESVDLVRIDVRSTGLGATHFELKATTKARLVLAGHEHLQRYLKQCHPERYERERPGWLRTLVEKAKVEDRARSASSLKVSPKSFRQIFDQLKALVGDRQSTAEKGREEDVWALPQSKSKSAFVSMVRNSIVMLFFKLACGCSGFVAGLRVGKRWIKKKL